MDTPAIRVEHLSKMYRIGAQEQQSQTRTGAFKRAALSPIAYLRSTLRPPSEEEIFWALQDISFEVRHGEVVGIIGRNGAGKSTLLKILSRITEPTSGRAVIKGRVGSLLEVGTGFHPELTGRENIFLNGTIMGMRGHEIQRKFDEIVDFSGVEKFIDTPVKRYSSGMYVRLAFAVAAHLEPDILIIDEVLAVGDTEFQKKCLGKIENVSKGQGRTVLFVSHNMAAITNLCSRCVVLEHGSVSFLGAAAESVSLYLETMVRTGNNQQNLNAGTQSSVQFLSANVLDGNGEHISSVSIFQDFFIEMTYRVGKDATGSAVPNFHFKTSDGTYAFTVSTPDIQPVSPGIYRTRCKVPGGLLNDGTYSIGIAITECHKCGYDVRFFLPDYLMVAIIDPVHENPLRYKYAGPIPGVVRPTLDWETSCIENETV